MALARIQTPPAPIRAGIAPLLVTFAAGGCLIAAFWTVLLRQVVDERAEAARTGARQQAVLAAQLAGHLRQTIGLADQLAQRVREEVAAGAFEPADFHRGLVVVNADGSLERGVDQGAPLQVGTEPYFARQKDHREDAAVVDVLRPHPAGGTPQLFVSRRLSRADGSFGGVVVVLLDGGYFDHALERLGAGAPDALLLLLGDGTVLGSHRASDLPAPLALVEGKPDALGLVDHGGRRWAVHPVPEVGYAAVGRHAPELGAAGDWRGNDYLGGIALTALVGLMTAAAAWLAARTRHALLSLRDSERRANAANALKSGFVARISHDLRTPLNGIIGFADLLREAGSNDQERLYARQIYDSATHLHALVDQILDLTGIEAGAVVLRRSEVELPKLLRGLVELHEVAARRKGLTVRLEIGEDTPFHWRCDEVRLRQILGNLLHNAVKFTEAGGVLLRADRCDGGVLFEVRDSGPGIPPEAVPDLFTAFHRADAGVLRRHEGSGLGLAITKELVELHGGQISVHSTPGAGTTFRVVLPR